MVARRAPQTPVQDSRRRLPAVGVLCADPAAAPLNARFGVAAVTRVVRAVLAEARERMITDAPVIPTVAAILDDVARRLEDDDRETLFGVINATGVVIHTNLGRAPLAPEAQAAMVAAAGYANLELDLGEGRRASRHDHLGRLISDVTGSQAGLAVNNCAGAVMLALAALAAGTPVIVSRGELVEIGGGFRVPDIVAQSGARLVEIGTTNRTHLRDYEQAVRDHPEARIILRTHPSNFRITGFTSAPTLADLAGFARKTGLLIIEDLGGGALVDLAPYGIHGEPRVQDSVRDGADLVIFSGDKLLGGPQAGIVAGRRELVQTLAHHSLARALRIDKLSLAALAATLRLYRPPGDPTTRVPVLKMLTEPVAGVEARARMLHAMIAGSDTLQAEVVESVGYAGGGAMPMNALPSRALVVRSQQISAEAIARRLRTGPTPVVGRIDRDRLVLDLRTVGEGQLTALAAALLAL